MGYHLFSSSSSTPKLRPGRTVFEEGFVVTGGQGRAEIAETRRADPAEAVAAEGFRRVVLHEYTYACAVCGTTFRLNDLVEATAAHIVPKHQHGTDDPRNGLSLCRTHHWAFDTGFFTLSDEYTILVSPAVQRSETRNFALVTMTGQPIALPAHEIVHPHRDALHWHREHVWLKE